MFVGLEIFWFFLKSKEKRTQTRNLALSSSARIRYEIVAVVLELRGQSLEEGRGAIAPGLLRAVVAGELPIAAKFLDVGIGHALSIWKDARKTRTSRLHASSAVPDAHVADNECPFRYAYADRIPH